MKENLSRSLVALVLGFLVALGDPTAAWAQSQATTGEVGGRVVDAQGAVVPGVTVTVKSPNTGLQRTAVTDQEGLFSIALLPPDSYELVFELSGFAVVTRAVRITVGSSLTANQTMQVSSVAETVTVTASVPVVETGATVRTTTIDDRAIENLPINGRRFQDFITLTPTVQSTRSATSSRSPVNAASTRTSAWTVRTTTSRSSAASGAASARARRSPFPRKRCRNSRWSRRDTRRSSDGPPAAWST